MSQATWPPSEALFRERRIDQVCSPFEAVCKAAVAGGPWPRIEEALAGTAAAERAGVLRELIHLDVHYRRRAGQQPACADYQDRFPELESAWLNEALAPLAGPEAGQPPARLTQTAPPGSLLPAQPSPNRGPAAMPLQLGDYRILREIGRGGMGVVYEAMQESLGRHVALKVLPFPSLLAPTHRERFQREARAAARLHHTNIVPVFGVGAHGGLHYYAMQFIEGQGLDRVLGELRRLRGGKSRAPSCQDGLAAHVAASLVGGLPSHRPRQARTSIPAAATRGDTASPPRASNGSTADGPRAPTSASQTDLASASDAQYFAGVARLGVQVAEALAYAHRQGILHRDIKPSNLLLDTAGAVWVIDFGLAKAEDGEELTGPGDIVGTVRYMAPERFAGQADARSDIYSLGLTLYELLTLRPAFQDSDPARLMERVRSDVPPPPRQVEPHVPRDLETIVLKAMAKEPGDRYPQAEALAEDLRRFLADRPILARRTSPIELAWRWSRRNPALTALVAIMLLLLVGGSGTAVWYFQDRAERAAAVAVRKAHLEQTIEAAVQEATMLGERAWELTETPHFWETTLASARSAIQRADALAADAGALVGAELHERVRSRKADLEAAERDRQLVAALERIRLEQDQVDAKKNQFAVDTAIPKYVAVFRTYGLEAGTVAVQRAAALIHGKRAPVQTALVAALDDWVMLEGTAGAHRDWLTAVVAAADRDEWRTKVRDAAARQQRETLEQLADQVAVTKQPPAAVLLLARALKRQGCTDCAMRLLRRAQHQFPEDFWIHCEHGNACINARQPQQAVACFQAALAVRPRNCGAHYNLGVALQNAGDVGGAIAAYQRAIELNPEYASAHNNMGNALLHKGDRAGAIAAYQRAVQHDPQLASGYYNLGIAFRQIGDLGSAIGAYEQAVRLEPKFAHAHYRLGNALQEKGNLTDAIAAYQRAIDADPMFANAYNNLGNALWDQGDSGGAIAAYQKAIQINPKHVVARVNLGNAFRATGDLAAAVTAYQKAIELNPNHADAHCSLGTVFRLQGKFADSLRAYQRGHELGSKQPGWRFLHVSTQWVREAERLVELGRKLPAILTGQEQPANAAARIEYAHACGYKGYYAAGVWLYQEAFAAQPALADDVRKQHRYNAACLASRAGTGQGEDAGALNESQRAELRRQALAWLRANLAAWTKLLPSGQPPDRSLVQKTLAHWQRDPDLAALRDQAALAKLPEAERTAWQQFWADVAATVNSVSVR